MENDITHCDKLDAVYVTDDFNSRLGTNYDFITNNRHIDLMDDTEYVSISRV